MMGILAGLLGAFSGPLMRYVALAIGGALAITGAHLTIENWKSNLVERGERQCDSRWEARIREEAVAGLQGEVQSARALLETERRVTGELHDQITEMQDELERVREGSSGGDERCLSDGVLRSLGQSGAEPKRGSGAGKKAAPAAPTSYLQKLFPGAFAGTQEGKR